QRRQLRDRPWYKDPSPGRCDPGHGSPTPADQTWQQPDQATARRPARSCPTRCRTAAAGHCPFAPSTARPRLHDQPASRFSLVSLWSTGHPPRCPSPHAGSRHSSMADDPTRSTPGSSRESRFLLARRGARHPIWWLACPPGCRAGWEIGAPMSDGARRALVTGASAGIGRACAGELHAAGWAVTGASRRGTTSGGWAGLVMDVDDDDSVRTGVAGLLADGGRIDALVACAGWGLAGAVEQCTIEEAKA